MKKPKIPINEFPDNMSDSAFLIWLTCLFDEGGKGHERISKIARHIVRDKKMIDALLTEVNDRASGCPLDVHGWEHPRGCEQYCSSSNENISIVCWEKYFELQTSQLPTSGD